MKNIYSDTDSEYLMKNEDWHVQDSPWKARQIVKMLQRNNIKPETVVDVGAGAGEILIQLDKAINDPSIQYDGYDISPDAISFAKTREKDNVKFYLQDFTTFTEKTYDLLLMIDVFEHVPDYLAFIEKCAGKARYKLYHIPLDLHVSSLLRNRLMRERNNLGHLHYFSKDTALATLEDTGQKIVDYFYTEGAMGLPNRPFRTKIANVPRTLLYPFAPDLTVKLLGGYSLLVLAE